MATPLAHLRANESQRAALNMPALSQSSLRTSAKRLIVRVAEMGTVLTKLRPRRRGWGRSNQG